MPICMETIAAVYGGTPCIVWIRDENSSEAEGLKVYLCEQHHKSGKEAVHNCRKTRELLCEIAQREYEKSHTRKDWMKISKKNYRISKS